MSWEMTREVAEHSRSKGPRRLILLLLAEAVPRGKRETFISVKTIARRANLTQARVRNHLAQLIEDKELVREGRKGGSGNSATSIIPPLCPDPTGSCGRCRVGKRKGAETGSVLDGPNGADPEDERCRDRDDKGAGLDENPADSGSQAPEPEEDEPHTARAPRAEEGEEQDEVSPLAHEVVAIMRQCDRLRFSDKTPLQIERTLGLWPTAGNDALVVAHEVVVRAMGDDWRTLDAGTAFLRVLSWAHKDGNVTAAKPDRAFGHCRGCGGEIDEDRVRHWDSRCDYCYRAPVRDMNGRAIA